MPFSFKLINPAIIGIFLLAGCVEDTPKDSDIKTAIKTNWEGQDWEFSKNFTVEKIERVNGWKDGEFYWVEAKYEAKSTKKYYDIVFDCVEYEVAKYTGSGMSELEFSLVAFQMETMKYVYNEQYQEYLKTNPQPQKAKEVYKNYETAYAHAAIHSCSLYLAEKSNLFTPNLKVDDTFTYNTKLRFKKTEQGWRNL